ncbi:MAG: response regulator [Treponema sp.]|nr:response regulator [Treponema sp.]
MDFFNVLIADDEENIRNGLKCIIDWEKIGCRICGEAANGKDAINQIIDLRPDLVILDIKMPGFTGIEVLSQVRSYFSSDPTKMPAVLILSGYSDFDYAQKTMNLGASGYLLKPVDEVELEKKVVEIIHKIKENRRLSESSKNAVHLQVRDFILRIIQSGVVGEPAELSSTKFLSDYDKADYTCILMDLSKCDSITENKLKETIDNVFSFFTYQTISFGSNLALFIKTSNESAILNCLDRMSKFQIGRMFTTKSQCNHGLEGILLSYKQALELQSYKFYFSKEIYLSKEILQSASKSEEVIDISDNVDQLIFCIETYDKVKLSEVEKYLYQGFFNYKVQDTVIKKNIISCIVELRNKIIAKYPEREISDGETFEIIPKILDAASYDEVFMFFRNVLNNFIENFNFNTADSVIVKVISYIKNNYTSPDIRLENLGDLFNCNSAYLGKKFKKFTGKQFNTFLDELRIEDAKEKLLHSDLKVYQISKLVGYSNTDYFFMKFKKCTGLTPKEFKKSIEKGE